MTKSEKARPEKTLVVQPGVAETFIPPDQAERPEGDRISYRLRPPVLYDRVAYSRALAAQGARQVSPVALLVLLRRGAETILADSEDAEARDFVLGLVDEHLERMRDFYAGSTGIDWSDADQVRDWIEREAAAHRGADALVEVEVLVREGYPAYARALADSAVYWEVAGIEGCRLFLEGWTGLGEQPRKVREGGRQVTVEADLARIPPAHLAQLGLFINGLQHAREATAKNSVSPSPGAAAAQTSSEIPTTPAPTAP